ncbi:MAG TPA: arginine deiminase-related protein [Caulobacteraceae bacterium]
MRGRGTFLMTDPSHFGVTYEINPWMRPQEWSADATSHLRSAKALWRTLKERLELEGGVIHVAAARAALPDMVFPANAAVVLNGRVLMAKFRHAERAAEESVFLRVFENLREAGVVRDISINPGIFQEGAGDCIWDASRRLFWMGSGPRSSPSAAAMIADHFGEQVMSLPLATDRYYHLDTCFCPLSGGEILYYPPALTAEALGRLRELAPAHLLIEAADEDAERFSVNAVGLGDTLVMATPSRSLSDRLAERGYRVVGVDVSPFILSGGGAFCMTLRLDLRSGGAETRALGALQLDEVTS